LDNFPVIDLNAVIVEGALAVIAGTILLVLSKPKYLIFTMKAAAVFIATRAVFVAVTHLGIYPGGVSPDATGFFDRIYTDFGLQAGYFFSGHTGLTFLMALIFWHEKRWRYLYIIISMVFGVSVLLAHVHYSIDVLAAPYMTYGIFQMSRYLFAIDYRIITENK
jgi:membrane-associated phospholipid phosphatase